MKSNTRTPLVSVIIPIYNAEKSINDCLDSVTEQSLKGVEIICVDNNSTDNSIVLVKAAKRKYQYIKIFHERNQGAGPARNKGLAESKGEFVFFLDPDDRIYANNTLEKLYYVAKKNKVKIAGGSLYSYNEETKNEQTNDSKYYFEEDGLIEYKDYQFDWGYWRFLYERKFLLDNKINFPPYLRGQDTVFFVNAMVKAKKFYAIKDRTYWYNYSFSPEKHSPKTYEDYEKANLDVIKIANRNNLKELEASAQSHRIPLVSVIIPVYNVERYLAICLDSILAQTYHNLEIIIVDDDTLDSSGDIADEYAIKDARIKVIHKPENEGLNMARATGFGASTGSFITFVDSDDMIVADCIEVAVNTIRKDKTDLVKFGAIQFRDKKDLDNKLKTPRVDHKIILRGKKELYKTQFSGLPNMGMLMCVWGGVYSRELVERIDWKKSNYRIYEDNMWTLQLLEGADSGSYLSHIGYLYRNDDSITGVLSKKSRGNSFNGKPIGYLEFVDILIKEYERYNQLYGIEADKEINAAAQRNWVHRIGVVIENNSFNIENNNQYLPEALKFLYQEHQESIQRMAMLQQHLTSLQVDLDAFLGVKRSAKRLAGNIKRRIRQLIG